MSLEPDLVLGLLGVILASTELQPFPYLGGAVALFVSWK